MPNSAKNLWSRVTQRFSHTPHFENHSGTSDDRTRRSPLVDPALENVESQAQPSTAASLAYPEGQFETLQHPVLEASDSTNLLVYQPLSDGEIRILTLYPGSFNSPIGIALETWT
jgi:hypothetical protein